jgi:hypothetical protein
VILLNLNKALQLYEILSPHLPEYNSETDLLDFAGKIVDNIINSGKHANYIEAISIMENITMEEVTQLDANVRIEKFLNALVENDIVYLIEFCKSVNYA